MQGRALAGDWNPEVQRSCRSDSVTGMGKLVSSEGVGLVRVDLRFPRSPDFRWGGCREHGACETRARVFLFSVGAIRTTL